MINAEMDFFPKSIDFFKRFDALANIIHELGNLVEKLHIRSRKLAQLEKDARKMEEKADVICHQLFQEINQTFITPIDREDIYTLAVSLDDVIDLIENLASNVHTFSAKKEEKEFRPFIKLIKEVCQNVSLLVKNLKHKGKAISRMRELIVKINKIENTGDALIRKAFTSLFSNGKDPVEIIKWKDIFTTMEEILDGSEKIAHHIDEIIIKNY
jgi:predicted phosphate transport protein (TIGR00153 family)